MFKPLDICNCCPPKGNDSIIVGLLYVVSTIVNGVFSPGFFYIIINFCFLSCFAIISFLIPFILQAWYAVCDCGNS